MELKKNDNILIQSNIYKVILIIILPFLVFIGPYFSIGSINISHLYNFIILVYVIYAILVNKYNGNNTFILFFVFILTYSLISLTWSDYSVIGESIIFALLTGFGVMTFISSFNPKELVLFLKSLTFFTIVVFVLAVIEILMGFYLVYDNAEFIFRKNAYALNYPGVFFTNPNDLGQFLIVAASIMILTLLEKKKYLYSLFIIVVTLFILVNTSSRLSVIVFILIILVYYLISNSRGHINITKTLSLVLIFITSSIFLIINEINIFEEFIKVDSNQGYYQGRSELYNSLFELGLENLFFGAGLGGSYFVTGVGPHNMLLFLFADFGFIITGLFIFSLIISLIKLWKCKSLTIFSVNINTIILSIFIFFPIISSISSANEQRKTVWILLGIVFALLSINRKFKKYNQK